MKISELIEELEKLKEEYENRTIYATDEIGICKAVKVRVDPSIADDILVLWLE